MLPFSPSSESADAVDCEALTRRHARTFALASRFLPAKKRRGAFAVYAFCRVADDIVDRGANGGNRETLRHELAAYRNGLHDALEGRPTGPIFRELKWTVDEFGVPTDALLELMDGVAYDLSPTNYATWAELTSYCEGVASSVGSMCTYVFGVSGGDATRGRALQYARTLGVAMQLTNILRDVGEDAARGRCYLPEDDLSAFGITANEVLRNPSLGSTPKWRELMKYEIVRARALYAAAAPGIALLDGDSQRCARACAEGYAAILGAIEGIDYDAFATRAKVGGWARAGLMWTIWRSTAVPAAACSTDGPVIRWRERVLSRAEEMCA